MMDAFFKKCMKKKRLQRYSLQFRCIANTKDVYKERKIKKNNNGKPQ